MNYHDDDAATNGWNPWIPKKHKKRNIHDWVRDARSEMAEARRTQPFQFPPPRRSSDDEDTNLDHKESTMNGLNFPGGNKLLDRMFRKADGVVWDLMTGKIGVQTDEGIATLDGTGEDAQVNLNLMDEFGFALPAFAQATPKNGVQVGDIIYRGARNNIAWVISKTEVEKDGVTTYKFKLMKPNGETTSWNPPKVSLMGFESGVMVLRSLMSMLPGGQGDLGQMQSALMPLMLMGGLEGDAMDKMMPLMLMQLTNGQGQSGGMGSMMQTMMLLSMLKKDGGSPFDSILGGSKGKSSPFTGR